MIKHKRLPNGNYRVTAISPDGKVVTRTFGHSRMDEIRHSRFVEEHRSEVNEKPYRSRNLKALARDNAYMEKGRFRSDTGVLYHN